MIRKNPRGDLPQIHASAYVDQTAIICGKVIIEENVFIGFNCVVFNCRIGDGCVVRHNAVVDGNDLPPGAFLSALILRVDRN
jgi:carbonic anhydrase/acetyltransferase-like protein (isoleucine patch superfamily)